MKAGYARESTNLSTQDNAFAWQIQRLQAAGCDRIFSDRMSGSSTKRPGYNEMMREVKSGVIKEIVICSLTRLGRNSRQIHETLELLVDKNVKLTALDGSIDINTASGRANVQLQAVFAQLEKELIQERIRAGYQGMRANRYPIHAPFGYKIVDRKLELNPEVYEIAIWIRKHVIEKGLTKTTQAINEKYPLLPKIPRTPGGLKAWLQCPTIYGHLRYKKRGDSEEIIYRHNHPALFTTLEQDEIESALEFRRTSHGFKSDPVRFPLSGLVVCAKCGTNMQVSYTKNRKNPTTYYRCTYWLRRKCQNNKYTPVPKIQKAVIEALVSRAEEIANQSAIALLQPKENLKLTDLKEQLKALEKIPPSPHIEAAIVGIKNDIALLETYKEVPKAIDFERKKKLAAYAQEEFWETLEPEERHTFYRLLIKKITCSDGVQEIELWV